MSDHSTQTDRYTASASKAPVIFRLRLCVLKPEPDGGIRRLQQALKVLLRRFDLRCIELEQERSYEESKPAS
jgi:hypothetical protein